jgi:hypothetical protein
MPWEERVEMIFTDNEPGDEPSPGAGGATPAGVYTFAGYVYLA